MGHRFALKRDANHTMLVNAMEKLGVRVLDLSSLGRGIPDCLCLVKDTYQLVEIKNPATGYGKKGLSARQLKWAKEWQGSPVYIIRTIDEAIAFAKGDFAAVPCEQVGYQPEAA